MKTIVILYEHVSREYEICKRIANDIKEKEIAEAYVFSIHFQIDEVYKLAKRKTIDILAVPYAYKMVSLNKIWLLIRKSKIRMIFNFRHEQIGAVYNEFRLYPRDEFTKKHIYHSAWTELYREKLIEKGVPTNHIIVTQNPRADLIFQETTRDIQGKNAIAERFNLDIKKKWIILCESGYPKDEAKFGEMCLQGYSEEDLRRYNEYAYRDFAITEKQLNDLEDSFFEKYELIYRPHPGKKSSLKLKKEIHVISEESIYWWLNCVDIVVSRMSTTLFEAQAKGLKVYRFEPDSVDDRFVTYGLNHLPVITRIEEIQNNDEYYYGMDYIDYIGKVDGHSVEVISNAFKNLLETDNSLYKEAHIGTNFNYIYSAIRAIMSNKLSKIVSKSSSEKIRGLSKSLTVFSRDVPPEWNR